MGDGVYDAGYNKSSGRASLEKEFGTKRSRKLGDLLTQLGRNNTFSDEGAEYKVGSSENGTSVLLRRDMILVDGVSTKSEWYTVATMYDFVYYVVAVYGGTPMWLKSFV